MIAMTKGRSYLLFPIGLALVGGCLSDSFTSGSKYSEERFRQIGGYERLDAISPGALDRWYSDRNTAVQLLVKSLARRFPSCDGLTNHLQLVTDRWSNAYRRDLEDLREVERSFDKTRDAMFMFERSNGEFGMVVFRDGRLLKEFWTGGQSTNGSPQE